MNEGNRDTVLDFFRGIAILDMILVHFARYFPALAEKIIVYSDFAVEGFVLIAGFMIGRHYYEKYLVDRKVVTKRLIGRAFQIWLVQFFLILTINLPLYFIVYDKIRESEAMWVFLLRSITIINQLGLMHILPTFIPLFLVSPLVLYLLRKGLPFVLVGGSICLFLIGQKYPYLLDIGDKTIFPFILWQVYFVAGCLLGRKAYLEKRIGPININRYLLVSISVLFVALFIKHGKFIPPALTSKFPLNALGVLYGASILFAIYTVGMKYWDKDLSRTRILGHQLPLLGRHSLLAFIIHLYTAKIIITVNDFWSLNGSFNVLLILLSLLLIYTAVYLYECRKQGEYLFRGKVLYGKGKGTFEIS